MTLFGAIQIIKFCMGLRTLSNFIEAKVRAQYNAADLLTINKSCGVYVEATDVGVKLNEAEQIRNAFRDKDSKRPSSNGGSK